MSDMRITFTQYEALVALKDLKPSRFQRNKHPDDQIKRLAHIMMEHGVRHPIHISRLSGEVCFGHGRMAAAKLNGWKVFPVIYQDFKDDTEEYSCVQSDNAIAHWADLDLGKINIDIPDFGPDFDINLLGIKDFVLDPSEKGGSGSDPDDIPTNAKTRCSRGEVWQLGYHRVMCGDSTSLTDVHSLLRGECPILMVTDPPYGVEYDASWRDEAAKNGFIRFGTSKNIGKVANDDRHDWTEAYAISGSQVAYVWHAGKFSSLIQKNLEDAGYQIVSQIIWAKPTFSISRGDYHWQHEPCWYAVKKGQKHNWQGARDQSTLWSINRDREVHGHGTPKPVSLCEKSIMNNTSEGQEVYDPFGGSGSTLMACQKTRRKCFMMEIEPAYCDIILSRWEKFTGQKAELVTAQ